MSRYLASVPCRIRIPVRQYQAVALVVREQGNTIRLMHREAGLSLDVEEFESFATAEEYRDRLAGFLGLPPVIVAGAPRRDDTLGAAPALTRRTRTIRMRRPRFLARRRSGKPGSAQKIEGREIIARN